jgi:hypothetical protein
MVAVLFVIGIAWSAGLLLLYFVFAETEEDRELRLQAGRDLDAVRLLMMQLDADTAMQVNARLRYVVAYWRAFQDVQLYAKNLREIKRQLRIHLLRGRSSSD